MAKNLAVNVSVTSGKANRYELLAWLNETLQTGFTKLEQVCTGAAYCQLMDYLFPGSLDLSRVRFQSSNMVDTIHNYGLLQTAFRKVGVVRFIPTEALIKKNALVALTFLQWFQLFFDKNDKGRDYHPLKARGGQSMIPDSDGQSHQKVEIIVRMGDKTVEEPRKEKPRENLKRNSDVIVLVSDEDDDAVDVMMEQKPEQMETEVKEACVQEQQMMEVESAEATAEKGNQEKSFYRSDTLLSFIRKYRGNDADTNSNTSTDVSVPPILSPTHPKDIIQTCYRTPYCLYLYVGVNLGGGQTTSVILIGYLDQSSGVSVVRLLHTLQMSIDADSQSSADMDTDHGADSDGCLLIETLKKFSLPLSNLAVFYCDAPHPVSKVFVSQLQIFNPRIVSLCGLPGIAGRACQAGLCASFGGVVDLIRDIHYHFSIRPPNSVCLKGLIADAESFNPSHPVSAQCSLVISTVQKMVSSWKDLVEYFKSLKRGEAPARIGTQLMDYKVKLSFLFLSHALEPLQAVQDLQQNGTADVAAELQLTSVLAHTYTASLLRPSVADHFLRTWDVNILHNEKDLRPAAEVCLGPHARDFMLSTRVKDMGQQQRMHFLNDAVAFYKAALQSLVECIPEHLGDMALRNISDILKHPENVYCHSLPRPAPSDLGVQLGLCNSGSPEVQQLEYEYFSVIKTIKKEEMSGTGKGRCWAKMLPGIRPYSILRRFLLTLLALPSSVSRTQVFAKVFNNSKETSEASLKPGRWAGRPRVRRRVPVQAGYDGIKKEEDDEETSTEDSDSYTTMPSLQIAIKRNSSAEDSDYTDNSSDVVDVTEKSKMFPAERKIKAENETTECAEVVYVLDDEDDDDDNDEDDEDDMVSTRTPPKSEPLLGEEGELVWGKVQGFSPWPAIIVPWKGGNQPTKKRTVDWYGQSMSSQISMEALKPFTNFAQNFCSNSFAILDTYREAMFLSLQEAAVRCDKQFSACLGDRDDLLKRMLDWACGGFKPTGPDGFKPLAAPPVAIEGVTETNKKPKVKKSLFQKAASPPRSATSSSPMSSKSSVTNDVANSKNKLSRRSTEKKRTKGRWAAEIGKRGKGGCEGEKEDSGGGSEKGKAGWGRGKGKGGWKGGKVLKKKSSLMDGFGNDASPDFVLNKKKSFTKIYNKINQVSSVYTQPDQKLREETIRKIMDTQLDIEGFCLCCGTEKVEIFHPLFKGSLCLKCKNNFTETLFRYDEDGYQSYCTICCYGLEVLLCGNDSCCRSYCQDCLNILVGAGTFESLKLLDPWICYLCQPHRPHGALIPREDWSIRVQELFANNSAMEFEPHRVYASIPANMRRPIRVLSLFDGIATGHLVLKELGFKVEKYVASEVCEDSIAVAAVNHDEKIIHVGDARFITEKHLEQWGPFDLLIGGSPCNDLSIVNPFRKGLYEGTGRLFFEFYRILQLLKPKEGDPRPFFWLFENVVFMNTHDKVNICRFLECNPVLVDAVRVSPAHRARYFWGNIPGMSRPIIASQSDKLCLQDCLEIGREARVTKVRTITTNSNSLKQGKNISLLPVLYNGKEDNLWITELEKIFGFPKHYTDVRNMNRQQRQKVLGKAWSVPVIRHLFAPLKDYFACEELPPMTNSNSSTSSTSPPSPASP